MKYIFDILTATAIVCILVIAPFIFGSFLMFTTTGQAQALGVTVFLMACCNTVVMFALTNERVHKHGKK